jgi:hypothetical protein
MTYPTTFVFNVCYIFHSSGNTRNNNLQLRYILQLSAVSLALPHYRPYVFIANLHQVKVSAKEGQEVAHSVGLMYVRVDPVCFAHLFY